MNKKGETDTLNLLKNVVLAGIVILFLAFVLFKVLAIFTDDTPVKTERNFEELANSIQNLKKDDSVKTISFQIDDGYSVFAINKDCLDKKEDYKRDSRFENTNYDTVYSKCQNAVCLCLWKGDADSVEGDPIDCKRIIRAENGFEIYDQTEINLVTDSCYYPFNINKENINTIRAKYMGNNKLRLFVVN